jgi:hypothetical protein
MSDDPKVIDLRQATLANLDQQLKFLAEAIIASNNRFMGQQRELTNFRADTNGRFSEINQRLNDIHSDVLLMGNQILNQQHDLMRLLRERTAL